MYRSMRQVGEGNCCLQLNMSLRQMGEANHCLQVLETNGRGKALFTGPLDKWERETIVYWSTRQVGEGNHCLLVH